VLVPFAVVYSEAIWGRKLLNLFTLEEPPYSYDRGHRCQKLSDVG